MVSTKPGKIEVKDQSFDPDKGEVRVSGEFYRNCDQCGLALRRGQFQLEGTVPEDVLGAVRQEFGPNVALEMALGDAQPVDTMDYYVPGRGKNKGKQMPLAYVFGVVQPVKVSRVGSNGQGPLWTSDLEFRVISQQLEDL